AATVTVDQLLAAIGIDPAASVLVTGETLDLDGGPVDARGAAIDTSLALTWSSSDESVATVHAGHVEAVGVGTAVIAASAGGYTGEATVDVRAGPRPTITSIEPAILGAADTVMITGSGFGADPTLISLTVAGVEATVIAATDTEITALMPEPGTFPCGPASSREVVVDRDGLEARAEHPVAGATRHALGIGESLALTGGDVACAELAEPGSYVISVFNSATSATAITAFQLRGSGDATLAADRVRPRVEVARERPPLEPAPEEMAHLALLEDNRRLVERLGTAGVERAPGVQAAAMDLQVGDTREFRIPDLDAENRCAEYISVTARAAYVGDYGIVWEDTLAPLAGTTDDTWQAIGREYDEVMHPILVEYFGDPLVFDDRLDDNGRFFMLFSETVNDFEFGVAGFVFSGDFYPRTPSATRGHCAASDEGEIFYGTVPTVSGDGYDTGTPKTWAWQMRSTVIHEVKHLTAYANKFDVSPSSPNFEEPGLEEATARLAEEFFGRALQGYGQFDNTGYQQSIWCERRVGDNWPDCDAVPHIMGKHYGAINAYLKSPELLSPFGRVDEDDWTFYGTGWQWVRWAIDQSGVPEADFIKALIREPTLTGPANLAARAGRSVAELLADYTVAMAVDDHPSGMVPARSELTMPSWDTRDMFSGLHEDYADTDIAETYPTPWPLAAHEVPSGDFLVEVPEIHGGAAAIIELNGVTGPQLLELLSESGATAPASLGLSIVRVR
ncbi:MAG: Ig domain-containing protein, partial [Gemmatimonadota bacterium]